MKRVLLFLLLFLILAPRAAGAGGVNLAWGPGCWGENPSNYKAFACDTNSGSAIATGSFAPNADQPNFVGIEVIVDLQTNSATLPDWWQFFNSGSCRQSALSSSADFLQAPQVSCADPWQGLAAGGIAAYLTSTTLPAVPNGLPNAARLKIAYALATPSPLTGGTEYYGFRLTITYAKTVGTGSCPGCATDAYLTLNEIKSAENTGGVERNSTPIVNACVYWQSGSMICWVPAHTTTWGRVKSLYR